MPIAELPGGGGYYDTDTGRIVDYFGLDPRTATPQDIEAAVRSSPFYGGDMTVVDANARLGATVRLAASPGSFYGTDGGPVYPQPIPGDSVTLSQLAHLAISAGLNRVFRRALEELLTAVVGSSVPPAAFPSQVESLFGDLGYGLVTLVIDIAARTLLLRYFPDSADLENGAPGTGLVPRVPGTIVPGGHEHIGGEVIVGSWTANGVTFYRLSSGKLAVQRKNGTVRIWRPKKPIVIFSGGAGNLRTMLRADKALDSQAKRLKKFLARRAPSRRRSSTRDGKPAVDVQNIDVR